MSDRPTFKAGERVRVTHVNEWTVKSFEDTGHTAAWLHGEDDDGEIHVRLTENVTVEVIQTPRKWTNGDVVLNPGTGRVWERIAEAPEESRSRWVSHLHFSWLPDDHISQHVGEFGWTVLRYQAEDAS